MAVGGHVPWVVMFRFPLMIGVSWCALAPERPSPRDAKYGQGECDFHRSRLPEPESAPQRAQGCLDMSVALGLRIPTKPATNSNRKPATDSDPKPATVPI